MDFLKYRKIYFAFSSVLVLTSIACLVAFGLNFGIDFTGGSILEIEYSQERPSNDVIKDTLSELDLGEIYVQPTGEKSVILRMRALDENGHQEIISKLEEKGNLEEKYFESIGPAIGKELEEKTKLVILLSLIAIVLYIAFAFRRISRPIPSWQYGIVALIALAHDVLIPVGIFSILGKYQDVQITIPLVTAFLTVFGYSVNDTVVVFDRIRENLIKQSSIDYEEAVNQSLNQTLSRSVNTSCTTLFVLLAIFFFGGETLKYFSLALILGISFGTYSSIFLAGPLLVTWLRFKKKA
ncbi:protein translocase subunit SecF [Candidatus Parcubacteria bacterium]|nr:protein translocase subunit SecF [Candidatus Parcubacteria bacterium]